MNRMVQIFIAHSSEDKWLIDPICQVLDEIGVTPYVAEFADPTPHSVEEKLDMEIKASDAAFFILTSNTMQIPRTRDTIMWEYSRARAYNKPTYVFGEKGVEVPLLIGYTTYYIFDPLREESLDDMMDRIEDKATEVKEYVNKSKAALAIIIAGLGLLFLLGGKGNGEGK